MFPVRTNPSMYSIYSYLITPLEGCNVGAPSRPMRLSAASIIFYAIVYLFTLLAELLSSLAFYWPLWRSIILKIYSVIRMTPFSR
jgi:hypothetical protein